ncbi:MAG: CYTH domain-containing protein [Chloroflexota bacterium]|jgi:CYTH domain-containing protein|nr:CYTH domain-containing protein [Lentimicrobium sp.]
MAYEIERKFLVTSDEFKQLANPVKYMQGYIAILPDRIIRVRIAGEIAYITIKFKITNLVRKEYEYKIPLKDAEEMLLDSCSNGCVEKLRYTFPYEGHIWEVDEFKGENTGLIVAEIELPAENTPYVKPPWAGEEVTDDDRYLNANLAINPYNKWK